MQIGLTLRSRPVLRTAQLALGLLWLWIVVWLAAGDGSRFLGYVNAFGFFWGCAAALIAVILLLQRAFLSAALAIVAAAVVLSHGQWPLAARAPEPAAGMPQLRVVTASLRTLNPDMDSAARLLAGYRPDILIAQEVSDIPAFIGRLSAETRRNWHFARRNNEIVATPWPILAATPDRYFLRAEIGAPGGPITVWTIHAAKSYSNTLAIRLQAAALADDVRSHSTARIVAGDFNATPWNDSYRTFSAFLTDAFAAAGRGPGFTFPTRARRLGFAFPYLRIDHIFVDEHLQPVRSFVGTASEGADHLPVIADLVRTPPQHSGG